MNYRSVLLAAYVLAAFSCSKGCSKPAATAPLSAVTAVHASAAPAIDGEAEDPVWLKAKPTEPFADADGGPGRPYAEVRASWDDAALYLLFYSGDEDLEPDDVVSAELTGSNGKPVRLAVSVTGQVQAPPEVRAAVDRDGTVGDAGDDDEEWLVEVAVPWSVIGKTNTVTAHFGRHDRPKGAASRDLSWAGEIKLAP